MNSVNDREKDLVLPGEVSSIIQILLTISVHMHIYMMNSSKKYFHVHSWNYKLDSGDVYV